MLGEEQANEKIKNFKCDLNIEIESFIKERAIDFSKKSIAETFIVSTKYREKDVIVAYFTLTYKIISVQKNTFTGKIKKRIFRFAQFDEEKNYYLIPLPLIGQIGKNYFKNYNNLISGEELLNLAFNKIKEVQDIVGGRFTFIECSDNKKLKAFYENNGFKQFSERKINANDKYYNSDEYLVQMIIDLSNY